MSSTPTTFLPRVLPQAPTAPPWTARLARWIAESRSHRVICLVLGIWLLNAFDLVFTILSHEQGMLHEENPVAQRLLENGTASIILFKIGLVLMGSYPLLRFRRVRIAEMAAAFILLAYALLAVRWSVCYDLYAISVTHAADVPDLAGMGP